MRRIGLASLVLACVRVTQIALLSDGVFGERSTNSSLKIQNELHIDDKPVTLWIAAGPRHTDRVLAHALRLTLKRDIGFKDVELFDATYGYDRWMKEIACDLSVETNCSMRPMLHMGLTHIVRDDEADFDVAKNALAIGELGPRLRRGWFLSSVTARKVTRVFGQSPEHWLFFTNASLAGAFTVNEVQIDSSTRVPEGTWRTEDGERWCDKKRFPLCDESGQFIPRRCAEPNAICATVLAAFPHESYEPLVNQILELKLYVKVAWFGTGLDSVVTSSPDNIVFFDYSISPLTHERENTAGAKQIAEVLFPSCNTMGEPKGCIYHSARMLKVVWQNLRHSGKQIYRLMRNIKLTAEEYNALMGAVSKVDDDEQHFEAIAYDICKTHWGGCDKWAKDVDVYPNLFVLTIVKDNERYIEDATLFALDTVNRVNQVPFYYMKQRVLYGNCSKDTLNEYMNSVNGKYNEDQIIAVVSPQCKLFFSSLVNLANSNRHAVISYQAEIATIDDEYDEQHEYFFRVAPDSSIINAAYMELFRHFGWQQFVHFYDNAAVTQAWNSRLRDEADYSELGIETVALNAGDGLKNALENKMRNGYRILIGDFQVQLGLRTMCMAHQLGMTWQRGYVWLLPSWLPKYWFNVSEQALPENCTVDNVSDAINYSITFRFKELEDDSFRIDAGYANVYEWRKAGKYSANVPAHVGYAYDSIWTLARSLYLLNSTSMISGLQDKTRDKSYMTNWTDIIQKNPFNGVSGKILFTNNARQSLQLYLDQYLDGDYTDIGTFSVISARPSAFNETFRLRPSAGTRINEHVNGSLFVKGIKWPGDIVPTDRTQEGSPTDGEDSCPPAIRKIADLFPTTSCESAMAIAIVSIVLISVIALGFIGGGFAYRHYERKVRKIEQLQQQGSPLSSLSEFELPEDSVRIYRSLGEGAFGKVYLGEFFKGDGCGFPVAVKAAKDAKNLNAKLELLSEAEVMKRFEHINILSLIGVITQHDKCQIVTEFMMFGNLRSYLQDRRHLAVKGELNAEQLTRMALDISRGLSYLASLNYVHGDLACRNCLVHETLTIKIADFGFCKNLVDQDYYRLVRSGPVPVRWMSPELLSTGVYHVQSDIWSFGVVLYEIVTFGAYPYSDLDDHKIQDFIRSGGFPTLPQKISSKLEALFLQIWTLNRDDRPTALEIFEILATDPDMVHPCLEEGPSRLDYISLEAQGRVSRGSSAGNPWNIRWTRSPAGSAHNTGQRIRFNATTGRAKLDIA